MAEKKMTEAEAAELKKIQDDLDAEIQAEIDAKKSKKKPEVEYPLFEVVAAPGFFDGQRLHVPGDKVIWRVPDGWEEARGRTHYAFWNPPMSFRPLNKEAADLVEKIRKEKEAKAKEKR